MSRFRVVREPCCWRLFRALLLSSPSALEASRDHVILLVLASTRSYSESESPFLPRFRLRILMVVHRRDSRRIPPAMLMVRFVILTVSIGTHSCAAPRL